MVNKWLIVIAVVYYFYIVTCSFFTAQVAQEKGRKRGWGVLGFLLGILGFVIVCFLPNAKKVAGDTNPLRLAFKKLRSISPVAVWIVLAGIPLVILGAAFGPKVADFFSDRGNHLVSIETEDEKQYLNPATVKGEVQSLYCGDQSNYVITAAGDVYAWGKADMTTLDESGKVYQNAEKVCMAGGTYYVLTSDHVLYAKGDNTNHLIPGQSAEKVSDFVRAETKVKDIALCETVGAVLKESGNLYVYGVNTYSQLGVKAASVSNTEKQMAKNVKKVVATDYALYYMTENGKVFAVGNNAYGQFGVGDRKTRKTPRQIAKDCLDFAAGDDFVMLLKKDGTVWTAGNDCYGQLGRKTIVQLMEERSNADKNNEIPKSQEEAKEQETIKEELFGKVEGLEKVTAIAAGGRCAFAFCDTTLYAWGENYLGQLGLDPAADVVLPELVHKEALSVASNGRCTLLHTAGGKLLGTGDRRYQQLGGANKKGFAELAKVKGAES